MWQANSEGFYDSQLQNPEKLRMRGYFKTAADGRYWFKTTRPVHYPIPTDGPVGRMLQATNRHPNRPAHIHFSLFGPGEGQFEGDAARREMASWSSGQTPPTLPALPALRMICSPA